jgi:hypothetical protein
VGVSGEDNLVAVKETTNKKAICNKEYKVLKEG